MPERTTSEILDREYLQLRARVLELAASFDRIQRGTGSPDERLQKIRLGIEILLDGEQQKARRVQEHFSRQYLADWRDEFGMQ